MYSEKGTWTVIATKCDPKGVTLHHTVINAKKLQTRHIQRFLWQHTVCSGRDCGSQEWCWAMCGHGRVDPVQLNCAQCVASGRKNALLSHQDVNYRETSAELDRKDVKASVWWWKERTLESLIDKSNQQLKTLQREEWEEDADRVWTFPLALY